MCIHSEHLGRRLYFHICVKENVKVFDIRYFWKNDLGGIKPQIIGVQLSEHQYEKICKTDKAFSTEALVD